MPTPERITIDHINALPLAEQRKVLTALRQQKRAREEAPYAMFRPYPGWQTEFFESQAKIRCAHCGNQVGKSYCVCCDVVLQIYKKHPFHTEHNHKRRMRVRVIGKDEEHTLKQWETMLHEIIPRSDITSDYEAGRSKIRRMELNAAKLGWDECFIEFMTYGMDVNQFGSVQREIHVLDEVPPEEIYQECELRMMAVGGTMLIAATPQIEGENGPFFRKLIEQYQAEDDETAQVFCGSMYEAARAGVVDYTEDDVRKMEARMPEDQAKARIHGELVNVGGLVFKEYRDRYYTDEPPGHLFDPEVLWPGDGTRESGLPPQDWQIVAGLDPSVNGFTGCLWCAISPHNELYFFDEYYERDKIISQHAASILELEARFKSPVAWRVIDPASEQKAATDTGFKPIIIQYAEAGLLCYTNQALKDEPARIDKCRNALLFKPSADGLEKPQAFVSQRINNFRSQLMHVSWQRFRNPAEHNPKQRVQDVDNHLTDCFGYIMGVNPSYYKDEALEDIPQRYPDEGWI